MQLRRLFDPDRLREAIVGTAWRLAAITDEHAAHYTAHLVKNDT